ncbi:nuclear transport factor 2 family protein [Paraburkholderia sp. LEh10]|uniref:nuclear transport factor 2 family protein n=1 Tax=Paraburkholderia sp. LEh10 TaxID=2821353 RepID=UPI001AEA1717|nr:nuclear transport factor 2 family protein [Paraburkholderia sp. LEh10]MBP0590430.1 nuclear transport factor 2 family protein [Paraburkholderia sp. LEh10]
MFTTIESRLFELERQRCRALTDGHTDKLARLLSPKLSHVHATGRVENLDQYLRYVSERAEFLQMQRSNLQLDVEPGFAVMTGGQSAVLRLKPDDGRIRRLEAWVTQLWVLEGKDWRLRAFQATPLPMATGDSS